MVKVHIGSEAAFGRFVESEGDLAALKAQVVAGMMMRIVDKDPAEKTLRAQVRELSAQVWGASII